MKKTGLVLLTALALMSCSGGANDGRADTDTTTFPSEVKKTASDSIGLGAAPDTSANGRTPSNNGAPASPRPSNNQAGDNTNTNTSNNSKQ